MNVQFVAGFAIITTDPSRDSRLFMDDLGLDLHPPSSVPGSDYVYSEDIAGARHFGVWPLDEAAQACFGIPVWPDSHPVPQATIEFEVDDVAAASEELVGQGHLLVHAARTEPWGQVISRFQTGDGLLIGVCFTPSMRHS